MTDQEIKSYVGKTICIRGTQHVCVAAGMQQLMLLQLDSKGNPIQYIVAHSPSLYKGELVWDAGDYFIAAVYGACEDSDPMIRAIRGAALAMQSNTLYVAMADDDIGCRCVGAFTHIDMAMSALDKLIAQDSEACRIAAELGKDKLTYQEYRALCCNESGLDNAYWIEERRINQPSLQEADLVF